MDPMLLADLLPGVLGITLVIVSLQGTAVPLITELSAARELDDRLLAPLPVWAVAVQKVVVASIRGALATAAVVPAAAIILPGGLEGAALAPADFAVVLLAGALTGTTLGTAR